MTAQTLREISAHNLKSFGELIFQRSRLPWRPGTFPPRVIALAGNGTISLSSTLVISGQSNISTGLVFGIPLPVQPMKAIAAVAIARSFTNSEIAAAGIFVSACILLFTVTGVLQWVTNVIPIPVAKDPGCSRLVVDYFIGGANVLPWLDVAVVGR